MPKRIALLGSTGSIGTQTLDVISRFPDEFEVEVLTAGNNVKLLSEQARKFIPSTVVIGNSDHYLQLKNSLKDLPIRVNCGEDSIAEAAASHSADMVVVAMVGYSGLRPTIAAIKAGKRIALANKETLVVAGEIIKKLLNESGSKIIPVDSEHSAIFQCLAGERNSPIEKITLTASGGPFYNYTEEMLKNVRPHEALRHPNWEMGNKVTIDSASLMNKGLEVIEARWLFDLDPERISVVIHPQSIIHSLVHFGDGSVKAQMGVPDMRVPILYALSYPDRFVSDLPKLNLCSNPTLTFIEPDLKKYRNLALAYSALRQGGNMPCILNAANEVAVNAFLSGKVGFMQMPDIVEHTMNETEFFASPGLGFLETSDSRAREIASKYIDELKIKS